MINAMVVHYWLTLLETILVLGRVTSLVAGRGGYKCGWHYKLQCAIMRLSELAISCHDSGIIAVVVLL